MSRTYLRGKARDSLGIVASRDDSRELTRKSTRGIFVLHFAGLLELRDERLTWYVRGSVPRLDDFRGPVQPERE